jgi:hypothetical protein
MLKIASLVYNGVGRENERYLVAIAPVLKAYCNCVLQQIMYYS